MLKNQIFFNSSANKFAAKCLDLSFKEILTKYKLISVVQYFFISKQCNLKPGVEVESLLLVGCVPDSDPNTVVEFFYAV